MPSTVPDSSTLPLMTALVTGLLPVGVARVENGRAAVDLNLVLTGPGGGAWDLALGERGEAPGDVPEVTIARRQPDPSRRTVRAPRR